MLAAAQTISAQNPNGTPSAWVPVFNDLTHFGDNFSSRRLGEAALILQIPGVVAEQMLPPVLEQGTIVASNENYNFTVTDTTTQYALDPVGSTTYVLLANAGSPNFSSIQLPLTTADQYAVSYEVGTTWSQSQIVQPLQTVNLPANVVGLQVALEDSTGSPIPDPGSFTFYVTFATTGTFSGNVTVVPPAPNPPPPGGTTADMILRDGTNGDFEIYNLGNNVILAAAFLGQVGLDWQFAGLGHFFGTDSADMMLRNTVTGAFQVYDTVNNNITATALLGQVGLEWKTSGFGHFMAGGAQTDMMLTFSNNGVTSFEAYGISDNQITTAALFGLVGTEWQVTGFGPGNGTTDMVVQRTESNNVITYGLYHDIKNNQFNDFSIVGKVGSEWNVVGFADLSGNGTSDMIVRRSGDNAFGVYHDINDNQFSAFTLVGPVGSEWQVMGFGPIGQAGRDEMLTRRNSDGMFAEYTITNNQFTFNMLGAVGTDWQFSGIAADAAGGSMGGSGAGSGTADSTAQLVQAMAGFGGGSGAGDNLNAATLSAADMSQQSLLTTPQHA
jgi:hypothetical protein